MRYVLYSNMRIRLCHTHPPPELRPAYLLASAWSAWYLTKSVRQAQFCKVLESGRRKLGAQQFQVGSVPFRPLGFKSYEAFKIQFLFYWS